MCRRIVATVLLGPGFLVLSLLAGRAAAAEENAAGVAFFEKHIRPVLVQQCYKCHSESAGKSKGGLLLDTRDGIRKGGETGHAVVPGDLEESLILSALRHESFEMPPGAKLPDEVIANFETWIRQGAADPREGIAAGGGKRVIDIEAGRKFWAFQPPQQVEPAKVKNDIWPHHTIDRFVLAKLEQQGLKPVADAKPHELIRRIYFDVTGLPPSPGDIQHWTERLTRSGSRTTIDQEALGEMIDKLLDSRQFGERWGRHWLDVVRYADSNGNTDNIPFPEAWRYRNWVIDACNQDKPYNEFLIEQIAGDLLPFNSPQQRNQQVIATGFLALGSKPRAQNNPNFRMDIVSEQIEVTSSAMLGLTIGCARCHDHKFDPIPTSEFYALAGIFESTNTLYGSGDDRTGGKRLPGGGLVNLVVESDEATAATKQRLEERSQLIAREQELTASLKKLGIDPSENTGNGKQKDQIKNLKKQLARLEESNANPKQNAKQIEKLKRQIARLKGGSSSIDVSDASPEARKLLDEYTSISRELASLENGSEGSSGKAMGAAEGTPTDTAICIAGESTDRGPIVKRGLISVVTPGPGPEIPSSESGRRQLAEWIASADNPLTARVMVNRIWHHLFGRGLVASVDNFGELGERPTHPELLDWLAVQLVNEDWSVKRMIRTLLLTRAYQMSSEHDEANYALDPDNTNLWRMNPRRLDAEELRDAMLAFSGELDLSPGQQTALSVGNKKQAPQVSADTTRRSVYLPIVRNGEPESLMLFDFADPSIVVGARQETTVPSQSLYLMNSPFVVQQAKKAANLLLTLDRTDAERIDEAFLMAFGRPATDQQRAQCLTFLEQLDEKDTNQSESKEAWTAFCQSLMAAAEFRYLD